MLATLVFAWAPLAVSAAAPVIDSLAASSTVVVPGGTVTLTVDAHDPDCADTCTTGCGLYIRPDLTLWTPSAGTTVSVDNGTAGSPYTASMVWQLPEVEGTYTVTVSVSDSGTFMCGGRGTATQSLSVQVSSVVNNAPVIEALSALPDHLHLGEASALSATASDPDGDPLTWAWSATAGTLVPGVPGEAAYTAAETPGVVTVTLTVTDDKGAPATRTVVLYVTSATAAGEFRGALRAPQRLASDAAGYLFVVDRPAGGILVFGPGGSVVATLPMPEATAVAVDGSGRLLVGTDTGAQLRDRRGGLESLLDSGDGYTRVSDVAVDAATGRLGVLYGNVQRVVVFNPDGTVALRFGQPGQGEGQSTMASALACGPDGAWYVGDPGMGRVLVFDPAGLFVRSVGSKGTDLGEFAQLSGLAVDAAGTLWVSDAFQSRLTGFSPDGSLREVLGAYGEGLGQLHTPLGVTALRTYGKLAVASLNSASVQLFAGVGATDPEPNRLPTAPTPINPSEGALLPRGSAVTLEVLNASDPDYQALTYDFELYEDVGGTLALLRSWQVVEGAGTTAVDASPDTVKAATYAWRCRAADGLGASAWSAHFRFAIGNGKVNRAPGLSSPQGPVGGQEAGDLVPFLVTQNASDADGDLLYYTFEAAVFAGGAFRTVAASSRVAEGASLTAWQVPAGALAPSQDLHWRVQATDTFNDGPWTDFGGGAFQTPPFAIPEPAEVGQIPGGDDTRPAEVRYRLGPLGEGVTLYFQLYDVSWAGEVTLEVNGGATFPIPAQVGGAWSLTLSVQVPASALDPAGENRFRFVHSGSTDPWGIRNVSTEAPPIPVLRASAYNTVVDLAWPLRPGLADGTAVRLYRAFAAAGPFSPVGEYLPSAALARDTGLMNDTDYYYRACYVDASGREGEPSAVVAARPAGEAVTPITDLRVVRDGDDLVLSWTPVTSLPGLKQVEVYRDVPGQWVPDTGSFTNLLTIEAPTANELRVAGAAASAQDIWYSVIPTDYGDRRATP